MSRNGPCNSVRKEQTYAHQKLHSNINHIEVRIFNLSGAPFEQIHIDFIGFFGIVPNPLNGGLDSLCGLSGRQTVNGGLGEMHLVGRLGVARHLDQCTVTGDGGDLVGRAAGFRRKPRGGLTQAVGNAANAVRS